MRLRFSVRDLLWLMVVTGLIVAWWLDHRRQAALHSASNAFVESLLSRDDRFIYMRKLLAILESGRSAAMAAKNPAAVTEYDKRIAAYQQQLLDLREQLRPR